MAEFSEIPVLDISALHTSADLEDLAHSFREVYANTGFGYIVGHGIDQALIDAVFDASARFHALPHDQKMQIALDQNHRGFIAIDTSTDVASSLGKATRPNQSESFMMMREDVRAVPGVYLSGPNQWPDLDGFRADVSAYHDAMTDLGRKLVGLIALALGCPEAELTPSFDSPTTWLRLLHYPSTQALEGDDLFGSAPHTDFGFLTFLAQDDVGGLQVQTPLGAWVDVPKVTGSFVLNVGDMLHRWSNGVLKSTPHRVINRSGKARYSCPFFFDPHVTTDVAPLESCVTQRPAGFAPLNFGEFLRAQLEASYDSHQGDAP